MIRFACACKNRFEVPEEEAGGMLQCPAHDRHDHLDLVAGRLPDHVPRLGETDDRDLSHRYPR